MRLPSFAENLLFKTNKVLGLECVFQNENDLICHTSLIQKSGNSVEITSSNSYSSMEQFFAANLSKDIPVILTINGKGIMHKKVSLAADENYTTSFHKIFPTGNEHEFYTQIHRGLVDNGHVSVIRKHRTDELIAKLQTAGYTVIDFFIGPFIIENALAIMAKKSSVYTLSWETYQSEIEDNKIKEYQTLPERVEEQKIELGSFSVDSFAFIAFCAAFHYFVPLADIRNNATSIQNKAIDYKNNKAFVLLLRSSVIGILIICLINFLVFSNYFDEQKKLTEELNVYQNSIAQYDLLVKEEKSKSDFLEKSGLGFSTKNSYYTDRLLYDLPEEIQLTYLSVFPIKNKAEKDSLIKFDNKSIMIKGDCQKSIVLNSWINLLKTKDFVADAVLENYELNTDKGSGKFDLTIKTK